MIERKFVAQNMRELEIKEFIKNELGKIGISDVRLQNTPLGEKIVVATSRPGLVVGRAGSNITKLTTTLKKRFSLQNPQIEIEEIKDNALNTDAAIVAEMIASTLERYGSQRFKGIGHKYMSDVMNAGALGVEILLSGRIPSARAKTWRFYDGYLKKCGDLAITGVDTAYAVAKLKTGVVGVQVRIMPATTRLPDDVKLLDSQENPAAQEIKVPEGTKPEKKKEGRERKKPRQRSRSKKQEAKTSGDEE